MPLDARHPDELALHHQLRDALNRDLTNTNFFVWIDVRPTGKHKRFTELKQVVAAVDEWLSDLDPDAHYSADRVPERWISEPAAEIKLAAIPRRREVRDRRAKQIVGNPEPMLVGWEE
jgi:hypothetical protein